MSQRNIERLFNVIDRSLFFTDGKLGYKRITQAITRLATEIENFEGETESIWSIGEFGHCTLADLITGSYWHYAEWHSGQASKEYFALSMLGQIFTPNMETIEKESGEYVAFEQLGAMAEQDNPVVLTDKETGGSPFKTKTAPYCLECGSDQVTFNGRVEWCVDSQSWLALDKTGADFPSYGCDQCQDSEAGIIWLEPNRVYMIESSSDGETWEDDWHNDDSDHTQRRFQSVSEAMTAINELLEVRSSEETERYRVAVA